jgi:CysZ protein
MAAVIRHAFSLAFAQMREPSFRMLAALGAALSLVLLFVVFALLVQLFVGSGGLTISGDIQMTRLSDFFSPITILLMLGLSVFLMMPVASLFTGLHLNAVADAVEARHYPDLPPPAPLPPLKLWGDSARYFFPILGINLLGIIGLFLLGALWGFALFWFLNGWLLSREYLTMIAERRDDPATIHAFRQRHRGPLLMAGFALAFLLSIPVLNLVMPVIGVAVFTHLAHTLTPHQLHEAAP